MTDPSPVLSPARQARYHLGCAMRHVGRAGDALTYSLWFPAACLAGILAAILLLSGCTTTARGARWYAPTTWSIFSGSRQIDKAAKAEAKVDQAKEAQAKGEREAVHIAHVEFRKSQIAAVTIPDSPAAVLTKRTLDNGLGLLAQVDPLSAAEEADALGLVRDLLSADAKRVAAAESRQLKAEGTAIALSKELGAALERIATLEAKAAKANGTERATHEENLVLANELRAQSWRFWIAVALCFLCLGLALYARLALGGVGAALHAAGAPVAVVQAIDGELSKFGQWMIRTGRLAAAKVAAVKQAAGSE